MKWEETIASDCRWSEYVAEIFGKADILLDNSSSGYQGNAEIIGALPDGRIGMYSWSYGSCSGCDSWENEDEDVIRREVRDNILWFDGPSQFLEWLDRGVHFSSRDMEKNEEIYDQGAKISLRERLDIWMTSVYGAKIN